MVPYPISALAGNTESELWDDSAELIQLNRELRLGERWRKPWPEWLFAVGQMDGESYVAIDVRDADAPTWWVDHGHIDAGCSGRTHKSFKEWVADYLDGLRSDLEGDGFEPDARPEAYRKRREREEGATRRQGILGIVVVAAFVIVWLVLRTSRY